MQTRRFRRCTCATTFLSLRPLSLRKERRSSSGEVRRVSASVSCFRPLAAREKLTRVRRRDSAGQALGMHSDCYCFAQELRPLQVVRRRLCLLLCVLPLPFLPSRPPSLVPPLFARSTSRFSRLLLKHLSPSLDSDPATPSAIRSAHPTLARALDTISEKGTTALVAASIGAKAGGGKIVTLLPVAPEQQGGIEGVVVEGTLVCESCRWLERGWG